MTEDEEELWKLHRRTIVKVGNSLGITIHKDEREKIGLEKGDELTIKVFDNGKVILTPLGTDA